jgi:peptidoglycan/LPS O-acetylase OafA/YrhL
VPSFAIAVLLLAALITSRPEIQPIDVFLVFPLLIFLSAESEPPARLLPLFATLGSASYAIYILHEPIHRIASAVLTKLGMTVGASADMAIFVSIIPICLWLDQSYDSPLRLWLRRRLAVVGQPKTV